MTRATFLRRAAVCVLLAAATTSNAQYTMHAVAGRGVGDGRAATAASLDTPTGVTVAPDGALLIADWQHHRIRRVDPQTGIISTLLGTIEGSAGNGQPASVAQLKGPVRALVAANGDLLVVERTGHRIRRLRADGLVDTLAGTGSPGSTGDGGSATAAALDQPADVAEDAAGNVYIADQYNHTIRRVTPQGVISTVAGTGAAGYSANGTVATAARLHFPACVLVAGNALYICDKGNHVVRRVENGVITTVAGTPGMAGFTGDGPAPTVRLDFPDDLALLPGGQIVVADEQNHRLRLLDPVAGTLTTIAGTGMAAFAGDGVPAASSTVHTPAGLAVDGHGRILVAERGTHRIRALANGTLTTVAGDGVARFGGDGGAAVDATLRDVKGAAADTAGNLYVSDDGNNRIRRIDPVTRTIATIAGSDEVDPPGDGAPAIAAGLDGPSDVIVDAGGNVLIADTRHHRVRKVDAAGIVSTIVGTGDSGFAGDGGPASAAQISRPTGLAFDAAGNLYVADSGNNRIRRVTPAGTIGTLAGIGDATYNGDGIAATAAALNLPTDVAFDASGHLLIADFLNHRIRRIDRATGVITTIAGTGEAGSSDDNLSAVAASLNGPTDVVVDAEGNILIADSRSNRIRRVTPQGVIDTVAGGRTPGDSGDGGPALDARLLVPLRLMRIPDGRIYVSCFGNHRVRVLVPPGVDPNALPIGAPVGGGSPGPGPAPGPGQEPADDGCTSSFARCAPGGGPRKTDCVFAWSVAVPPAGRRRVDCTDGDPSCDRDQQPGQCTVRLTPCFNVAHPQLPACQPSTVTSVRVLRPQASSTRLGESAAARALIDAMAGMGAATPAGSRVAFQSALAGHACTRSIEATVAVRGKKKGKTAFRVQVDTTERGPRARDVDTLVVRCLRS